MLTQMALNADSNRRSVGNEDDIARRASVPNFDNFLGEIASYNRTSVVERMPSIRFSNAAPSDASTAELTENQMGTAEETKFEAITTSAAIGRDDIHFDSRVFLKELFYNLFWPFSHLFVLFIDGSAYTSNHDFWNPMNMLPMITAWSVNVLCIVYPVLLTSMDFSPIEVIFMNLSMFMHKVMIATKYAYFSKSMLQAMHNEQLPRAELLQQQLITGWRVVNAEQIEAEMDLTARSIGVDLTHVGFMVPVEQDDKRKPVELKCKCLKNVLHQLTADVYSKSAYGFHVSILIFVYAFLQAIVPPFVRAFTQFPSMQSFDLSTGFGFRMSGPAWVGPLVVVLSAFSRFWFAYAIVMFVGVGVLDLKRRARMLTLMHRMIDPSPLPACASGDALLATVPHDLLFVDLSVSQNIGNWFIARQLVQNFGLQFQRRIAIYIVAFVLLLVTLALIMLVEMLQRLPHVEITITLVLFNMPVFVIGLLLMVYWGSYGNFAYWTTRATLTRTLMAMREHLATINARRLQRGRIDALAFLQDKTRVRDCSLLIQSVIRLLEVEDETNPVTIVGFRASFQLLNTVVTIASALVAIGVRLVQASG